MLVEKASGMKLNDYIRTNLTGPLGIGDMLLAPQDIPDDSFYKTLAHQNIFTSNIKSLLKKYSQIPNETLSLLNLLGIHMTSSEVYDFDTVVEDVNEIFCKTAWASGAMIGTSADVAIWGYNLLSENGASFLDGVREKILGSMPERSNVTLSGYGIRNYAVNDSYFIGHEGRCIGLTNDMLYDVDTDCCFAVFQDVTDSGIKAREFIYELNEVIKIHYNFS